MVAAQVGVRNAHLRASYVPLMRRWMHAAVGVGVALLSAPHVDAKESKKHPAPAKPWCAPEVNELSDHTCYAEGGPTKDGRHTLVIYMHGMLVTNPGFPWLQHRAMAMHAKNLGFTVLMPTSPQHDQEFVWPTSERAQKEEEAQILANIRHARAALEKRVGHSFDETFVVGFSSGAYYASSLALRNALPDVDGYILLAGGATWAKSHAAKADRPPVFVGVSAADKQTRDHSRAYGSALTLMGWPVRVEERNAGHMVDWSFMRNGIAWLRAKHPPHAL